ncbi:hypothetical protein RCG17_02785 [Neobacillus sp. PS3-12]|jgi:hypothetical protein|uniref:hypothetical protein n=1 Tax=Neobacillus sp. PS3-12 TaxID=3070677 RepID=UPI0027DFFC37|nr:hypothetical protein [Neobacillus sp. PS3-12]WML53621.1 hypothetical protein RCG17_02785 [Neobacillus sp. PS3-12]
MVSVKSVKIDGEEIHIFKSMIYIFESNSRFTLELDMIVSEIVLKRYKNEETLIIEIELDGGRLISSIMNVHFLSGRLPQMNAFMDVEDPNEYLELQRINENNSIFPDLDEGITIEEIRKVEMPNEKVTLKLNLPIDQVEWLKEQKARELNEIFKELIYNYWSKRSEK